LDAVPIVAPAIIVKEKVPSYNLLITSWWQVNCM
jgi:hypothetical protein